MSSISANCLMCMKEVPLTKPFDQYEPVFCSHNCHNIFLQNVSGRKRPKNEEKLNKDRITLPPLQLPPISELPRTIMTLDLSVYNNVGPSVLLNGRKSPVPKNLEEVNKQ